MHNYMDATRDSICSQHDRKKNRDLRPRRRSWYCRLSPSLEWICTHDQHSNFSDALCYTRPLLRNRLQSSTKIEISDFDWSHTNAMDERLAYGVLDVLATSVNWPLRINNTAQWSQHIKQGNAQAMKTRTFANLILNYKMTNAMPNRVITIL